MLRYNAGKKLTVKMEEFISKDQNRLRLLAEPMSQAELVDTIRVQLSMYSAGGQKDLIIMPGNYGESFLSDKLNLDLSHTVKCSDFIGETIDMACGFKMTSLLLAGHLSKLVKLGSGIMNMHSRQTDDGMETLAECIRLAGGDADLARRILYCNTMDDVLEVLWVTAFLQPTMQQLMHKIDGVLKTRAGAEMEIEAVMFSNRYGVLGKTPGAEELIMLHRKLL